MIINQSGLNRYTGTLYDGMADFFLLKTVKKNQFLGKITADF
jgi:hypothetical protein